MPSRILELIKKRVKLQNEEEPKPNTKEQHMNFGILKSSETPLVKTKGIKPEQSSGETTERSSVIKPKQSFGETPLEQKRKPPKEKK